MNDLSSNKWSRATQLLLGRVSTFFWKLIQICTCSIRKEVKPLITVPTSLKMCLFHKYEVHAPALHNLLVPSYISSPGSTVCSSERTFLLKKRKKKKTASLLKRTILSGKRWRRSMRLQRCQKRLGHDKSAKSLWKRRSQSGPIKADKQMAGSSSTAWVPSFFVDRWACMPRFLVLVLVLVFNKKDGARKIKIYA